MSRRLNIGQHGTVALTVSANGTWRARTRQRGLDGIVRTRQATGHSTTEATAALDELLASPPPGVGERLSGDSPVRELAAAWVEELSLRDEAGVETRDYYRRGIDTLIVPLLGEHRISELRPVTVRQFYTRILTSVGPDGKPCRTPSRPAWAHKVLSQMLRYAVEVGAIDHNPVIDLQPQRRNNPEIRVLSLDLFREIRAAVAEHDRRPQRGPRRSHGLLEIYDLLAATGARVGELLALRWCDVNLAADPITVTISGTLLPPRDGLPLRRKEGTKSPAGMREIAIPEFAADTLRRMKANANTDNPAAPVFTNRNGTWLAPGNIRREWRAFRAGHDWDWVTPQTFRKTVATLIDRHYSNPATGGTEGAGAPVAAAVLGHSSETITRTYYIRKQMRRSPDISAVLQDVLEQPLRPPPVELRPTDLV